MKKEFENKVDVYALLSPAAKAAVNRTMAEVYSDKSEFETDKLLVDGCSLRA